MTNEDSEISFKQENLKMITLTSQYFSIFNNTPPAKWITHITKDYLAYCFCSYYSFITISGEPIALSVINKINNTLNFLHQKKKVLTPTLRRFQGVRCMYCVILITANVLHLCQHWLKITFLSLSYIFHCHF